MGLAVTVSGLTCAVVLFCAGWFQFELTSGAQRRQLLWLILSVCSSVPVCPLFLVAAENASLAISAGIALVGPDDRDVRGLISRIALHVVMLTFYLSLFATCAAGLQALKGGPVPVGLLGVVAALIAAAYHPILLQARGTIDELLFGGRADPVITLGRLGEQLTSGIAPEQWLESLRSALAVPSLVLHREQDVLAAAGDPTDAETTSIELRVGDDVAGELVVALPPGQLQLPPTTRAVLQLVAAPLAQALQAAHLSEQLLRSRGHVVGVLEEERRRMRRDLHDGLGPTLTGVAYTADAAANSIASDPSKAAALLQDLRADVGEAIAEIRRIFYCLRPKASTSLGWSVPSCNASTGSSPATGNPSPSAAPARRCRTCPPPWRWWPTASPSKPLPTSPDTPPSTRPTLTSDSTGRTFSRSSSPTREPQRGRGTKESASPRCANASIRSGAPSKQPRAPRAVECTPTPTEPATSSRIP